MNKTVDFAVGDAEFQATGNICPAEPDVGISAAYVEDLEVYLVGNETSVFIPEASLGVAQVVPCSNCSGHGSVTLHLLGGCIPLVSCPRCGGSGKRHVFIDIYDYANEKLLEAE